MFRTAAPATEPDAPDVVGTAVPTHLIPLSHLELDLPAPPEVGGWGAFLSDRHIEIVVDDIGRLSVSRADARRLLAERREAEAHAREVAAERDRQAVEADRVRRAQIWTGAPAVDGVPAATLMLQVSKDARPKRLTPLQEALAGEGMTYHALRSAPDGD